MKVLIVNIIILMTLQTESNGQSFFNLTDSSLKVGQIKRVPIEYQLGGGCLPTKESLVILDSIYSFLERNKNILIEIGVHSDYRGDSIINSKLTILKARHIKDYLIEKGIDSTMLICVGYGENEPLTINKKLNEQYSFFPIGQKLTEEYIKKLDKIEKQEIANMLNSRTEFKIIDTNKNTDTIYEYYILENKPVFQGGDPAMFQYISKNIKYPEITDDCLFTKIYITFIINKNGKCINPDVSIKNCKIPEKFKKEIIDMILNMPTWSPGEQNGEKVNVKVRLPINIDYN